MKGSQKKKLLHWQIRKFLSRKKEMMDAMAPVDRKLSKLKQKLAAIESGEPKRTVTEVDCPGGSYEVVEYGDETADEQEII